MNASKVFEDCWKRIKRADAHRDAFQNNWNSLSDKNAHTVSVKVNDQGTGIVRAILIRPIRHDLALTLGEFFYQLRAALDGAVYCAAVVLNDGKQPPDEEHWEFPILTVDNHAARKKLERNVGELPDQLREWIKLVQPYNTKPASFNTIRGALRILHDCARKDRHRRLHVVLGVPGAMSGVIKAPPPAHVIYYRQIPCNLLEDECDFLGFGIKNYVPGMRVDFEAEFAVQIAIDEIPGMTGETLGGLLQVIQDTVKTVIVGFAQRI